MAAALLAVSIPVPSVAGPSPDPHTTAQALTASAPTVTAHTAGSKPTGALTNAWGSVTGIPAGSRIETQIQLANGTWSLSEVSTVRADGTFVIELTHGKSTPGNYRYRVVATHGQQKVASKAFTLVRTRSLEVTFSNAGSKPAGAATNAWGTVAGAPEGTHVETQVRLPDGRWSRSQTSTTRADGTYVIPLTYGAGQVGTTQWRVVAKRWGTTATSRTLPLTRTPGMSITFSNAGTKPVGAATNAWGTVTGVPTGTHVETQVQLGNGKWSRSQTRTTRAGGSYVIPLTYGAAEVGTTRWRVVARHQGTSVTSRTLMMTRTATGGTNPGQQPAAPSPAQRPDLTPTLSLTVNLAGGSDLVDRCAGPVNYHSMILEHNYCGGSRYHALKVGSIVELKGSKVNGGLYRVVATSTSTYGATDYRRPDPYLLYTSTTGQSIKMWHLKPA